MNKASPQTGVGSVQPVMRSTAHRSHAALGAEFENRGAWMVPATYGDQERELKALREGLGFADISARGKLQLTGAVEQAVKTLTGSALDPGQAAAIASGGLIARIARNWAVALLGPSGEDGTSNAFKEATGSDVAVTDVTSAMAGFLVGGRRLRDLLARTVAVDVAAFEPGRCIAATWARIPTVMVVRDLDVPIVELYVGSEHGRYAWETLEHLAGALGGTPVGWRGLEALGWT